MRNLSFHDLQIEVKVGFVLTIAEKVFIKISVKDERYSDGREALDKCWSWVESQTVTGDELYELIDNPDFTGISEYAEEEDDLDIARIWSLMVDAVAYTSWEAFKSEGVKYLPQSLEGISTDSISTILESAVETSFVKEEEINRMVTVVSEYSESDLERLNKKEDFLILFDYKNV
ncbi:Imm6 family immunity protein [Metabacillus sp. JX24]|uniref:Imm6 family immunity protein n=1 Tax=Metabacillus sp. JX24 TaxID=3240759 RepID=UPI00350F3D7F